LIEIFNQTFTWYDLSLVPLLILLEQVLSADNAFVLSALIQPLPTKDRKKALLYGLFSGLILRMLMILSASYLFSLFWVQILGGLYLIYVGLTHLLKKSSPQRVSKPPSLALTILKIEFMDLVFAIDSVLAAFALVAFFYPASSLGSKMWIVYLGGLVGMAMMRFTTLGISLLIDQRPYLLKITFFGIAIIGGKLIYDGARHWF
jgi:YkoY family integral membrane protein